MENKSKEKAKKISTLLTAAAIDAAVGVAGIEALEVIEQVLTLAGENPRLTKREAGLVRAALVIGQLLPHNVRPDGSEEKGNSN